MSKKQLTILVIVVVALAIVGGGVWYWKKNKPEPVNPPVTENENQPSENTKSEILNPNLEEWLTYRNEEYGFEVRYPKNMEPKFYSNPTRPDIAFKNKNLYFEVRIINDYDVDLSNYYFLDFEPIKKDMIANQEALIFEAPKGYCDGPNCGYPFIAYSVKKNSSFYNIVFYYDISMDEQEKYILNSFKFLN